MDDNIKVIKRPVDIYPTGGAGELSPDENCHKC